MRILDRKMEHSPNLLVLSAVVLIAASIWFFTVLINQAEASPEWDVLYGVNAADDSLSTIDLETGEITLVGPLDPDPDIFVTPVAMAVRPSDGEIFVWNNSDRSSVTGVLLTVDPTTGIATHVDPTTPNQGTLQSLAFDPDGRLFGVDSALYEVDVSTGEKIYIGRPGLRIGGADFDADGILYGVELSRYSDRLVIIDTDTAEATVVAKLDQNIGIIGSIMFTPDGTLIGTGFAGPFGNIFFDIDPADGMVSNIQSFSGGFSPQGLGFAPSSRTSAAVAVPLDIKPGSCPNPLNLKSKGVTPVAVLGTYDFYVSDLDLTSLRLNGVSPSRSSMEDVATPFEHFVGEKYSDDCNDYGPDGFEDLVLKFDTQKIVEILGDVKDGDAVILTLTGTLTDGTEIEGEDIVTILKNGKK